MKKIFSNLIRITISYSKFFLVIIVLSSSGPVAKADDAYTYLKCGTQYLQLSGVYIKNNYNIRTKKFLHSYIIKLYGEKWIKATKGYSTIWLNRDTGEMSWGKGSDARKYPCKLIHYNELPRVNDEGKKF